MILSVTQNKAQIFENPQDASNLETEALLGENFKVEKKYKKWVYGTLLTDNYRGWIKSWQLGHSETNTHKICKIKSHIYNTPSSKALSIMSVSLGSRIRVFSEDDTWAEIVIPSTNNQRGYIPKKHLKPLDYLSIDWIKTAELFLGAPYVWGGKSCFGIDCSGLIQLSLALSEIKFPRNSFTQFDFLKNNIIKETNQQRGDFIYWKGHIGIMLSNEEVLHSNGYHMSVVVESLNDVYSRIGEGIFLRL